MSARELSAKDLAAWSQLAARAVSPNPFFDPDFLFPAARGFDADVHLLVVRNGSGWLAALPVHRLRSWRGVPGSCVANWMHPYCFLGTPLVADHDVESTLATLIDRGLRARPCVALSWIDADGSLAEPLSAALRTRARMVAIQEFDRAVLRRRADTNYLEHALSARHRSDLRRTYRRLVEAVGPLTLTDRSDDPRAYEEFLALERSGWKGARGTALACIPGHAAFFREMCQRFAAGGRLQLLSLESEQRTVAMVCNLTAGDAVFGFKVAFDERLVRLSPGKHLQVAQIERFHRDRFAWIDSCADPGSPELNRLWPDRRQLRTAVAVRRGAAAAPIYAKWKGVAAALRYRSRAVAARSEFERP